MAWGDGARKSAEAKALVLGPNGPIVDRSPKLDADGHPIGPLTTIQPHIAALTAMWTVSTLACVALVLGRPDHHDGWWALGGCVFGSCVLLDVRAVRRALARVVPAPETIEVLPASRGWRDVGFANAYLVIIFPIQAAVSPAGLGVTAGWTVAGGWMAACYGWEVWTIRRFQRRSGTRLAVQSRGARGNRAWSSVAVYAVSAADSSER